MLQQLPTDLSSTSELPTELSCFLLQALFCQVPAENVLTMHDVSNIWRIPLLMQSQNAHKTILDVLKLPHYAEQLDMHAWKANIADRY